MNAHNSARPSASPTPSITQLYVPSFCSPSSLTDKFRNPLKRKIALDSQSGAPAQAAVKDDPSRLPKGEYESGRVLCESCGNSISFRDEETGGFTLKHWDAHRIDW